MKVETTETGTRITESTRAANGLLWVVAVVATPIGALALSNGDMAWAVPLLGAGAVAAGLIAAFPERLLVEIDRTAGTLRRSRSGLMGSSDVSIRLERFARAELREREDPDSTGVVVARVHLVYRGGSVPVTRIGQAEAMAEWLARTINEAARPPTSQASASQASEGLDRNAPEA